MRSPPPKSPASTRAKAAVDGTFEDMVKRLGEIVKKLESGDLPLEQSLALFEEGVTLSRASQEKLSAAEKRVDELLGIDREGKARTAPFELRGETGPADVDDDEDDDGEPDLDAPF
jgi:exodeoxyribonuclease VII small subunit